MRSLISQLIAVGPQLAAYILTTSLLLHTQSAHAASSSSSSSSQQIPSPNLDLEPLGRVALAGDFDSISLYTYEGQNQNSINTNGSQSLLTQYPDGSYRTLATADADILAMCPFVRKDGSLAGVVVGGNFTSLGGVEAQSIALWNPNSTQVTPLPGLSGTVSALYCDPASGTVYVGGSFMASNSTNAMAWTTGWNNLPFAGFNGPVYDITKDSNGNIVFAGDFDGLGNTTRPKYPDSQVINLGSGNITAENTASGSDDPHSIICSTGSGKEWYLKDGTSGYWQGNFTFGFNPTKLRLYNAQQNGHATKHFYFENLNSGGILNFVYRDENGNNQSCSSQCPLANNGSAQDYHFVPPVGMDAFRIYITDWWDVGGGLSGIEMFQDEIFSFAVNDYNEPQCDGVSNGSSSTASPASLWTRTANNGLSSSDYLTADIFNPSQISPSTSVVFTPNLQQSGNYSITVYTPGCLQDNTCSVRGQVNITGTMTSNGQPVSTALYQTNKYDKYDQVYYGYVDTSGGFKPSVTLTPLAGQNVPLTVVAQRVRFELITTTGGLNGLFEYNPSQAKVSTDFTFSAVDAAGASLGAGAQMNVMRVLGQNLYVGGNFSGDNIENSLLVKSNATALSDNGLNGAVQDFYVNGSILYMAGDFTGTAAGGVTGLNHVASYDTSSSTWSALGAGVDGQVSSLVQLTLNVTANTPEECITINGDFQNVNAFGGNAAFSAQGFAVWVPSKQTWLQNIPNASVAVSGQLSVMTEVPGSSPLYAGQLSIHATGLGDTAELVGSGTPSLEPLGIKIQPKSSSSQTNSSSTKRASTSSTGFSGVYAGLFYEENNLNVTVLGGHFSATASNGTTVQNLAFINNTDSETITGVNGLDDNSTFLAMGTYATTLFAGGVVSGSPDGNTVNGLIVYDLVAASLAATQPPAFGGDNVRVNSIAVQPNTAHVYVAGSFDRAGSLPCSALCYYDAQAQQWNSPGSGLGGIPSTMTWSSNTALIIAGDLQVNGSAASMVVYDAKSQTYSQFSSANAPGAISVLAPANNQYNQFWASGIASNGSTYLAKYEDNTWTGVSLGRGTTIRGLQVLTLTQKHSNTDLIPADQILLINGNINVPNFGNASSVLFNGTTMQPFVLTYLADGSQGSVGQMFVR